VRKQSLAVDSKVGDGQKFRGYVMTEPPSSDPTDGVHTATEILEKKDKVKRKADKVRSAWISFVGRILAQAIGATTAIVLGLMFVKHQTSSAAETDKVSPVTSPLTMARVPGALSIAVLPFQNFSSDPAADYLADGMTEALVTRLAQIPGLHVISRTSAMSYKQARKPLPEIAGELGVRWIVEGSYIRNEGRIRVTAQLIDANTDWHHWARSYDWTQHDLLVLQADVATAIARDVSRALAPKDEQ
jgi:TolB-like protein